MVYQTLGLLFLLLVNSGVNAVRLLQKSNRTTIDCSVSREAFNPVELGDASQRSEFVLCNANDNMSYQVAADELNQFEEGDMVRLVLERTGESVMGEPLFSAVSADPLPSGDDIAPASMVTTQDSAPKALHIRLEYSNAKAVIASEITKTHQKAFNILNKSSYGKCKLAWPKIETAKMNGRWESCNPAVIAKAVYEKLDQGMVAQYDYRVIWIPSAPDGGCKWDGLAEIGCGKPGGKVHTGRCTTWMRVATGYNLAQQFGYNFGLYKADGWNDDSGKMQESYDALDIMGMRKSSQASFGIAMRYQLGWLAFPNNVKTEFPAKFMLAGIDSAYKGNVVAWKRECKSCQPKIPGYDAGGYLWMAIQYGTTRVHLHRAKDQGTEQWKQFLAKNAWRKTWSSNGIFVRMCWQDTWVSMVSVDTSHDATMEACKREP
jgi:hypothetical protein